VNEQQQKVALAQLDIERAVLEIADREGLTFAQVVAAVGHLLTGLAKYAPNERARAKR
jgi:hypothetical protein